MKKTFGIFGGVLAILAAIIYAKKNPEKVRLGIDKLKRSTQNTRDDVKENLRRIGQKIASMKKYY